MDEPQLTTVSGRASARTAPTPDPEQRDGPDPVSDPGAGKPARDVPYLRDLSGGPIARLGRSFRFAVAGLAYLFRTQRNARLHLVVGAVVLCLAAWLDVTRTEAAVLVLTVAAVIILEGLNTAVEAAVDLACPHRHPLARVAKDVAAGMVLVAAIASVAIGLLILGPPLWGRVAEVWLNC